MGRFGTATGEVSISIIRRQSDETKTLTLTNIDRSIRELSLARAITHGPTSAAVIQAMAISVREALDLDEDKGAEYASVIDYYLSAWHRIPPVLPQDQTRLQYITALYKISSSTPAIADFKATMVLKAIKQTTAATEKLAEAHAKSAASFKFSHGSASPSPIRGGKSRATVSAPNSPARSTKDNKRVPASQEDIEAWEKLRPSFLEKGTKVMCKTTAAGKTCTRSYCKANDKYKGPDDSKHQQVVDWVMKSPFGTIQT
jgi:hypothetical protein